MPPADKAGLPVQGNKKAEKIKQPVKQTEKKLSVTALVYTILAFALVGMIILFASNHIDNSGSAPENMQADNNSALGNMNALTNLEDIMKSDPDNSDNLIKYANLLNDSGMFEKAIDAYKKYLDHNPTATDAVVDMGVCYDNLKKYNEAIACFKKGLEIDPKHQIAALNLGIVYSSGLNDKVQAVKWWKKAVDIDPSTETGKRAQEFLNQIKQEK